MEMLLSTAVLQHLPWITAGSVYVATVSYYKVKDMLRSKQMEEGFNEVNSRLDGLETLSKGLDGKINGHIITMKKFRKETGDNFDTVKENQKKHSLQLENLERLLAQGIKDLENQGINIKGMQNQMKTLTAEQSRMVQLLKLQIGILIKIHPELGDDEDIKSFLKDSISTKEKQNHDKPLHKNFIIANTTSATNQESVLFPLEKVTGIEKRDTKKNPTTLGLKALLYN